MTLLLQERMTTMMHCIHVNTGWIRCILACNAAMAPVCCMLEVGALLESSGQQRA